MTGASRIAAMILSRLGTCRRRATASGRDAVLVAGGFRAMHFDCQVPGRVIPSARTRRRTRSDRQPPELGAPKLSLSIWLTNGSAAGRHAMTPGLPVAA